MKDTTAEIAADEASPKVIADDRLKGAKAIGQFIDPSMTLREVRRLLEHRHNPSWREGRVYVASKRALLEHWREMTGQLRSQAANKRDGKLAQSGRVRSPSRR